MFIDELSTTSRADDSSIEQLFNGGFTRQVGILAARSKDIIGKKLYKCVEYNALICTSFDFRLKS